MRFRRTIFVMLVLASTFTLFAAWAHNPSAVATEWATILRAGPFTIDCGLASAIATPGEISKVDTCAQKALSGRQKFRAMHQFWGVDSLITYAIFSDGDNLLITGTDSMGMDPVVLLHPHFLHPLPVEECGAIEHLPSFRGGRLNCRIIWLNR